MGTARITFDRWEGRYAGRMTNMRRSAVRDLFAAASRPDVISLSGGMPDVRRIPAAAVSRALHEALLEDAATALQYGSSDGLPAPARDDHGAHGRVRASGRKPATSSSPPELSRRWTCSPRLCSTPATPIICEGPTYVGALQAFSAYEPQVVAVEMDEHGMRMDVLEAELAALGRARSQVHLHDPELPEPGRCHDVRRAPAPVARAGARVRHPGHRGRPVRPPALRGRPHPAPEGAGPRGGVPRARSPRSSRPGLRLGWMAAPPPIRAKVLLAKQGADLCGSNFTQSVVQRYFSHERWRSVLRDLTDAYRERRDAMLAALEEHFPPEARWTHPEGGFFVWVTLPRHVDTGAVLAEAVENGVTFVPGDGFYADGRGDELDAAGVLLRGARGDHRGHPPPRRGPRGPARGVPCVRGGGRVADEGAGGPAPVAAGATRGEQS